jgi:hypothetical protein
MRHAGTHARANAPAVGRWGADAADRRSVGGRAVLPKAASAGSGSRHARQDSTEAVARADGVRVSWGAGVPDSSRGRVSTTATALDLLPTAEAGGPAMAGFIDTSNGSGSIRRRARRRYIEKPRACLSATMLWVPGFRHSMACVGASRRRQNSVNHNWRPSNHVASDRGPGGQDAGTAGRQVRTGGALAGRRVLSGAAAVCGMDAGRFSGPGSIRFTKKPSSLLALIALLFQQKCVRSSI